MGNDATWTYETTLLAVAMSASLARVFVSRHLFHHRLPHLVDAIRLAASELVTNAVVHAGTSCTVTLSGTDGTVLLAVRDGSEVVPLVPVAASSNLDTGGRGMGIVSVLSRECGVDLDRSGSKTVWASFPEALTVTRT